jgi:hypothetical protein
VNLTFSSKIITAANVGNPGFDSFWRLKFLFHSDRIKIYKNANIKREF